MTPGEVRARCAQLAAHVGGKCEVYVNVAGHHMEPTVCVQPDGILGKTALRSTGATWEEMFAKAEAKWDEFSGQHRKTTIRAMALAIIEITASQGRCSDAALRMKFRADEIVRYGADAIIDANEIAERGPFSIESSTGANGAPNDEAVF